MTYLLSLIAGLRCPTCGGGLREIDGDAQQCDCGVLVVASEGKWRFPSEWSWRRLPGLSGWAYREPTVDADQLERVWAAKEVA